MVRFMSLKDHVYEYISNEISSGTLGVNKKIDENKISKELNISRTPVREALIQLSSEGYIENIPRKGFIVKSLKEDEAKDIYQVLGVLDGFATVEVCESLDEKDFNDMDFFIESMDIAIKKGNYEMYYKQQNEFHDIYLEKLDNEVLKTLIRQVKRKFVKKQYAMDTEESLKEILLKTNDKHRLLLKYLKDKEKDKLLTFMKEVHWNPDIAYMEVT